MRDHDLDEIRQFRNALGKFVTGVTVITTLSPEGVPVGFTANSFSSVSLTPPLVLWSLAKNAIILTSFQSGEHFNVHILSSEQRAMSDQFASTAPNRFKGVSLERGINEIPLIENCVARFQCRKVHAYDGGDHVIFVGEVLEFDQQDLSPLVYAGGDYAAIELSG